MKKWDWSLRHNIDEPGPLPIHGRNIIQYAKQYGYNVYSLDWKAEQEPSKFRFLEYPQGGSMGHQAHSAVAAPPYAICSETMRFYLIHSGDIYRS